MSALPMKSILVLALGALFLSATATAAPAGDVERGKQKSQPCAACHGADGNKTLDGQYPRIAGQYADYLAHSLKDYRSGARKNAIMAGFAKTLSDQDIADLALYFQSLDGDLEDLSHLK
ncbi:MAG TPA: cytochrome c [Xanthomonadales bacterium]|nr:cytochrome c [Xanthomonadales bacterium]